MSDITTEVLIDIRDELREMRGEVRGTNARLDRVIQEQIRQSTAVVAVEAGLQRIIERVDGVDERLDGVAREMRGLNARIDNVLIGGMGSQVREHESRIQRVEEHLGLIRASK